MLRARQAVQHGLHQAGGGIGLVAGNGVVVRHAAQPGDLALGQLAGGSNAALTQPGQVERRPRAGRCLGIECFPGLAIAHAAYRGQVGMQVAARAQRAHFVHKAFRQHGVKAPCNALMQPGAVVGFQGKKDGSAYGVCASSSLFCSVKVGDGLARNMPHLQRTLDALAVGGR